VDLYHLALFVHVSADIGLFIGLGVSIGGVARLRQARRVEQVRETLALIAPFERLFPISALLILAAGLYMALTVWGLQTPWIDVALALVAMLLPIGFLVNGRRIGAIARAANASPDGPLSDVLFARIHDPVLGTSVNTALVMTFAIVFLMTNKPPLVTSLLVTVVGAALGFAISIPLWRAARTQGLMARRQAATPAATPPTAKRPGDHGHYYNERR
jgi:hypothetical protein